MRNATLPSRRAVPATLAFAVLVPLLGCSSSPSEPESSIAFQTVTKTTLTLSHGPQIREVVRDAVTWDRVWRELWRPAAPGLPAIDFDREIVAVATAGVGCFGDVNVEEITAEGGVLVVHLAEAMPSPQCACLAAEYTFHAVRLPRIQAVDRFVVRSLPPRCS
ncbi:MAG TPA: hypothetical protein VEG34_08375 [Thermoanaerobaculia bacterium]|nr:hypothetical protein [Thermoanaerobaculia bacterium]